MRKSVTLAARAAAAPGRLAPATARSKSQVISAALRCTMATGQRILAAVEEGKQARRAGRVTDHETVVAAFNRLTATGR